MEQFEYLPQLIVAKDGIDEFANLIHISKSKSNETYYCPCCNGIVNRRALSSEKVQSHYYHLTGKCTKQEQINWFCKNWLFAEGSKFYVENVLYEVLNIEIEPSVETKFGKYKPSVLVNTKTGKTIYFELFFLNRKRENDYFCKWQELKNDVVNVNLKEFIYKDADDAIPYFTYLYHDGKCYLKEYVKNDLYANTIGKYKRTKGKHSSKDVLKEKINIELLDEFWQCIQRKSRKDEMLKIIRTMSYDELVICYEVIKRKECMKYLKDDILETIHNNSVEIIKDKLGLPYHEQVGFDIRLSSGKTYTLGIYAKYKSESIHYDRILYKPSCNVILRKNVHSLESISNCYFFNSSNSDVCFNEHIEKELFDAYHKSVSAIDMLNDIQKRINSLADTYKISICNNYVTILAKIHDDNYEEIICKQYMEDFNIDQIIDDASKKIKLIKKTEELNCILKSEAVSSMIKEVESYTNLFNVKLDGRIKYDKIVFDLYVDKYRTCIDLDIDEVKEEAINQLNNFINSYNFVIPYVDKINSCANENWSAKAYVDTYGCIRMDITLYFTKKYNVDSHVVIYNDETNIEQKLSKTMNDMIDFLEYKGLRIMEV